MNENIYAILMKVNALYRRSDQLSSYRAFFCLNKTKEDIMENSMPRNGKEGLLYGGVICGLTCIFMATINISISMGGLSNVALVTALKSWPIVFICAMLIEALIVGKIADKLTNVFSPKTDSFNARIMFRAFFTVIGMSAIMTNVGSGLGTGFNMELIKHFPIAWPRNFCIAIFLELIIVQPIARKIMRMIHKNQDNSQANEVDLDENVDELLRA